MPKIIIAGSKLTIVSIFKIYLYICHLKEKKYSWSFNRQNLQNR